MSPGHPQQAQVEQIAGETKSLLAHQLARVGLPAELVAIETQSTSTHKDHHTDVGIEAEEKVVESETAIGDTQTDLRQADETQIKAKEGVDLTTLQPEAQSAAETAQTVFAEFGVEAVVTSTGEGKHKEGSKHKTGQAIDLRTRDFPKGKLKEVVESLAASLGDDYDVVLEKDHIHVEFDPKGSQ